MTVQAQGEQGRAGATTAAPDHCCGAGCTSAAFVAWLIGGPFLIAAAPDAWAKAALSRLRGRHARDVRDQCGLPPAALVGAGLAPHAPGRPQRHLHRHRRHVDGGGRPGPDRDGRRCSCSAWCGRGGSSGSACARSGSTRPSGWSPFPTSWWAGARSSWPPSWSAASAGSGFALMLLAGLAYTAAPWSTPASGRTPGPACSASTRCSTPAPWWAPALFAYLVAFIALPRY